MGVYQQGDTKEILLSEFSPDLPLNTPGIILDAINAFPSLAGFRPMPTLASIGDALDGTPLGSFRAYYNDGTTRLFAATSTGIYRLNGTAWTAALTLALSGVVNFTQFGNDVLAVNNLASMYIAAAAGTTFSAIAGSPASVTHLTSVSQQVLAFAGQTWYSSASGNDTDWAADIATLAATGTLYKVPGPVVAAGALYNNAYAFKKAGILKGEQTGPPFSWSWDTISSKVGTWSQGCVIEMPGAIAFLGIDDFYMTTGYAPQAIPNNLKQWFFRTVDPALIETVYGWYDGSQGILYWHFISKNAPVAGVADRFISYNIRARRWCTGHLQVSNVPFSSVAATPIPLPTTGNRPIIFNGTFVPRQFSGDPGVMSILTGYYGMPGRLTQLMGVRPNYLEYPGTSEAMNVFHVRTLGKPDQMTEVAILDTDGWYRMIQVDRYHRWLLRTLGDCEIVAFAPELFDAGVA